MQEIQKMQVYLKMSESSLKKYALYLLIVAYLSMKEFSVSQIMEFI